MLEASIVVLDHGRQWSITEYTGQTSVTHEFEAEYDEMNRKVSMTEIDRTNGSNTLETVLGFDSRSQRTWMGSESPSNPTSGPT